MVDWACIGGLGGVGFGMVERVERMLVGIGMVIGGWRLSRNTHTPSSGLYVTLPLPGTPLGEAWCDCTELNDLPVGFCAWARALLHLHAHNTSPSPNQGLRTKSVCTDEPTEEQQA